MSQFLNKPRYEDEGGFPFVLIADFVYHSDLLGRDIVVPAGFETDLASIPRGLWNVIPKVGPWDYAAVIHDFLYKNNGVTRSVADAVLSEALQVGPHVDRTHRWLIVSGVRVGGWHSWNDYREKDAAK